MVFESMSKLEMTRANVSYYNLLRNSSVIEIDKSAALNSSASFLQKKIWPSTGLGLTYSEYVAAVA